MIDRVNNISAGDYAAFGTPILAMALIALYQVVWLMMMPMTELFPYVMGNFISIFGLFMIETMIASIFLNRLLTGTWKIRSETKKECGAE